MSKIIYACFRYSQKSSGTTGRITKICEGLNPDNIDAGPSKTYAGDKIIYGLSNPLETVLCEKENVVLGSLFETEDGWKNIGSPAPDGNFVIFRANSSNVEVLSDFLGTRNMWYYFDEDKLILSSSQKAIIELLGDFEFDNRLVPWMLFNGSLGPELCWDKRLKRMPANGKLILDRENWEMNITTVPVEFNIEDKPNNHKQQLKDALTETFSKLNIKRENWVITLSGGHDSRAILSLFKKYSAGKKIPGTVTWGEKKSLSDPHSDAYIAKILANRAGTRHVYYPTDETDKPIEEVVQLFLANGEGGIDHITGYLDGFNLWKVLFENNIKGIIRGDEIFGYNKIFSELIVRSFMGLLFLKDYGNLDEFDYLKSLRQELPNYLERKEGESISTWRDRIFQEYRIPYIQAYLADLKYPYLEQLNPFLSRKIVKIVRRMPDELRSDKKLFKKIMKEINPLGIPYSIRDSNTLLRDAVNKAEMVELIKKELQSSYPLKIFPGDFLDKVVKNMKVQNKETAVKKGLSHKLKSLLPKKIKVFLAQQKPKTSLDVNVLAFRIFIISRMHRRLSGTF